MGKLLNKDKLVQVQLKEDETEIKNWSENIKMEEDEIGEFLGITI